MKRLILILLLPIVVQASELNVTLGQRMMMQGGDDWNVGEWNFAEVTYKPSNSNFYYGISTEEAEVSPISYLAWTYSMTGLLVGTDAKISNNLTLFGHLGYYMIDNNISNDDPIPESALYYFNTKFYGAGNDGKFHSFDQATLENSDAFGGTVGVRFTQPISKNSKLGFSVSYRLLKINEVFRVRFRQNHDWIWAVSTTRDYSGFNFGMNYNYSF